MTSQQRQLRSWWVLTLLMILGWIAACGDAEEQETQRPRIVLFVMLDALAAGHVSHLGYDRQTTPNLDALAEEGVSFRQAITSATYTVASIPSIHTARLPDRHGLTWYRRRLPEEEVTLAELMRDAGYHTVGFIGVNNGGPIYGNDQGFDHFEEVYLGRGVEDAEVFEHNGRIVHMPKANEFIPAVTDTLDELAADESLFLYLHFLEPHAPYDPPDSFKSRFVDGRAPEPYQEGERERIRRALGKGQLSPALKSGTVRLYDSNIAWVDHNLGLIFDELRARGLHEGALIVVTSDHGEAFWQHEDITSHGRSLFEEEARVPLVMKLPTGRGPRGVLVEELASNIDILPTLGELLELSMPDRELDGISLTQLFEEGRSSSTRSDLLMRAREDVHLFGIRSAGEKAVVRLDPDSQEIASIELYDLIADPKERHDLAAERPERARALAEEILARLRGLDGALRVTIEDPVPGADLKLLEALGYTDVDRDE